MNGLVFDAVRVRLLEIGEAVKDIDPALLANESDVPWRDVAGMRDHLTHRYFDTAHSIVAATVEHDLPPLVAACERLLGSPDIALERSLSAGSLGAEFASYGRPAHRAESRSIMRHLAATGSRAWSPPRTPRHELVDLAPLACRLGELDSEAGWMADPVDQITPSLSNRDGDSCLGPATELREVTEHLTAAPPAWYPYDR